MMKVKFGSRERKVEFVLNNGEIKLKKCFGFVCTQICNKTTKTLKFEGLNLKKD